MLIPKFDQPLTLKTSVPADWTKCVVKQNEKEFNGDIIDGIIKNDAIPGNGLISIKKM